MIVGVAIILYRAFMGSQAVLENISFQKDLYQRFRVLSHLLNKWLLWVWNR